MDIQSLSDLLSSIISLLKTTYECAKNEERKRAEVQLQEYFNNSPIFMECLLTIIETPEFDEKVKESACFYFGICIKQLISTKASLKEQEASAVGLHIIGMLNSPTVSSKNKKNLTNFLSLLLNMENTQTMKHQLYLAMLHSFSTSLNRDEITGGCFIIQSLLNGTTDSLRSAKLFVEMAPFIIDTTSKVILFIFENFKAVIGSKSMPAKEDLESLQKNLELLESLCNTIRLFFLRFKEYKGNLLQNIVLNDQLPILFWQILTLQCFNESQIKDSIISNCNIPMVDSALNEIKAKILKCYTIATNFIRSSSSDQNLERTQFFMLLDNFVPIFIYSLTGFVRSNYDRLDEILESLDTVHIIVESLNFLASCGRQSSLYRLFAETKNSLIMEVVLPLLVCRKKEIQSFEASPEEFVSLALDTCDKQTFETPKTASAHLLEVLCDNIDGALTFLVFATCQILEISLKNLSLEEFFQKNALLKEFESLPLLCRTSSVLRADACLLSLCVLSYLIPRRADLVEMIESTVTSNAGVLFSTDNGILQARLCLFINYFSDSLFKRPETQDYFKLLLEYLLNSIKNQVPEKRALSLQAMEALNSLFSDDSANYRLEPLIPVIFKEFVDLIPVSLNNQFFDLLCEIVGNYPKILADNEESAVRCVENLVRSVLEETKSAGDKSKKNSLLVIKYLNCIKTFVKQKEIIKQHWAPINQRLFALYQLLDNNSKVGIGEYVLSILSCEMNSLQKKNECTFGNLFTTLNNFILYGGEEIKSEPRCIEILIIMGTEALISQSALASEASNSEGCVLLHLVIQKFHEVLSKEQTEKIINVVWLKLCESKPKRNFFESRLKLVFVNLFLFNYNATTEILAANNVQADIYDRILENASAYVHTYERKLVVIGLSSVLNRGFQSPFSIPAARLSGILVVVLTVLQSQLNSEGREKDKKNRRLIHENQDSDSDNDDLFDSDDDDDGEDDDEWNDAESEEEVARINLNQLNSVIKTIDEFEYFQQAVNEIRARDALSLQALLDSLDFTTQGALKEVLSSQRVKVSLVGNTTSVVRKIVKVKRN